MTLLTCALSRYHEHCVYRIWGAARIKHLLQWQEGWIHNGAEGFRCGCGTEDVYWTLAARIEKAILSQEDLYGVSYDFRKCFDLTPHGILFGILSEMGISERILKPIKAMYSCLRRRWKLGKEVVGSEWQCTNGILQGCRVSVVLLNALVTLWLHAVSVETPVADSIKPGGNADDIHAVSKTAAGVQSVHNITAEYASLSGQEISHDKSVTFAVTPPQRRKLANVMLEGRKLAVRSNVDILGVCLVMAQAKQGKTGNTAKAMKSASKV